ncbi:MAG: KH domain-containing protein [Elusimicrobia bacterium]|nr:KH domain-containing protein [Elusimicrobiota bacterium]
MKDLVIQIVKNIVDDPEAVSAREVEGEKTTMLEISAASSDIGKIIGRNGRTIKAIRTLLNAAGVRQGKRVTVEILDPK